MSPDASDKLNRIEEALLGNLENPGGLCAMVHQTSQTVLLMKKDMAKLQTDVDDLKTARTKLVGIFTGLGLVSGGIGAKIASLFH